MIQIPKQLKSKALWMGSVGAQGEGQPKAELGTFAGPGTATLGPTVHQNMAELDLYPLAVVMFTE